MLWTFWVFIIQRQAAAAAALRPGAVDQTRLAVSLVVQQPKPAGRNFHLRGRPARQQKPLLPATASQIPDEQTNQQCQ
jgi:hypothetical protein